MTRPLGTGGQKAEQVERGFVGEVEVFQHDQQRLDSRGRALIETRTGDIDTIVSGAFDTASGRFSDLFTIVGGTGDWADATGQLHLYGTFDFATGTGKSDYRGEVCQG